MLKTLIQAIASRLQARHNCAENLDRAHDDFKAHWHEWIVKHTQWLLTCEKNHLPSGAGIDNGTRIDLEASTPERIVFTCSYHHMNDVGVYDGWTEHTVIVTPSFVYGLEIKISGRNRNEIKDYLHDTFHTCLDQILAKDAT